MPAWQADGPILGLTDEYYLATNTTEVGSLFTTVTTDTTNVVAQSSQVGSFWVYVLMRAHTDVGTTEYTTPRVFGSTWWPV